VSEGESSIVAVAVDAPLHAGMQEPLLYRVPAGQAAPAAGTPVRVPLGRRRALGVVWGGAEAAGAPPPEGMVLRELEGPLAAALPALPGSWRELVTFTAGYYHRGLGEVALSVLPPALRRTSPAALARRVARLGAGLAVPADAATAATARPSAARAPLHATALSADQAAAVLATEAAAAERAAGATPAPILLFGATGSGKTEVYLRAAEAALAAGGQVLVLVPEINLTPQLEARFTARFPGRVIATLHSGLPPARRLDHWLLAHLGHADLVLGTRTAVFTPMPRLSLIVVDEEHDASFKQQEGARWSARDLAVWRGRQLRVPVLLGSATPSLESWAQADAGRYRRVAMPARIGGGAWPVVRFADLAALPRPARGQPPVVLAPELLAAIEARRGRGQQSLVLLNRRGFAPVLWCGACGWKSGCPHCSAWRVFHKSDRTLRCHHCGFTERVPRACPDCGNLDIAPLGRGTEKLAEQLAAALPQARIARIDADTARRAGALQRDLAAVHAGDVDVIVGTQIVAKGHDFRRITLVAAVDPDGALFSSDFRAPERLFALLMQAAGRAGRDAAVAGGSEMWVQTAFPHHPLYAALAAHDHAAFAARQLEERAAIGLPPFVHLALLRAEAKELAVAEAFAREAAGLVAGAAPEAAAVTVHAPVPPALRRLAGAERVQLLLESQSRPALQRVLAAWLPQLHALRARHRGLLRYAVDVDPVAI
jgi:primosomal protein N' (replication factor Y)